MTIATFAVKEFLRRKRDDWRSYKTLSADKVEREMDKLPFRPPIWSRLFLVQKRCLLIGAKRPHFGYHLDPGMGKTMLSLALMRYHMEAGSLKRTLVLVPVKANKTEWADEIRKHTKLDYEILEGSTEDKWRQIEESHAHVFVESYGGFVRLCCEMQEQPGKRKKKLTLKEALVKKLGKHVNGFVLDESTFCAAKFALATRICRRLRKTAVLFLELTGTPFGRDPTTLWGQIQLLDEGHTLGETLGLYRAAFFEQSEGQFTMFNYSFNDAKKELLHDCLAHCTISIEAEEGDLPDVVRIKKHCKLPASTRHIYQDAEHAFKTAYKSRETKGQQNVFMRMRQLSSGFMTLKDDEGTLPTKMPENPKLDLLMALIDEIAPSHKIIVFHEFNVSGDMIARELRDAKIGFSRIWGGTKDHEMARRDYEKDNCPILLLANSCGFGLNLQIARYGIFFESPVSAIVRKQCERRLIRQGSKAKNKFIIDLTVDNTADERILDFHEDGKDLFDGIIRGIKA